MSPGSNYIFQWLASCTNTIFKIIYIFFIDMKLCHHHIPIFFVYLELFLNSALFYWCAYLFIISSRGMTWSKFLKDPSVDLLCGKWTVWWGSGQNATRETIYKNVVVIEERQLWLRLGRHSRIERSGQKWSTVWTLNLYTSTTQLF